MIQRKLYRVVTERPMDEDDDEYWCTVLPLGSSIQHTYKCRFDPAQDLRAQFEAINILGARIVSIEPWDGDAASKSSCDPPVC